MRDGRGTAILRSTAGAFTTLGLAMLLIAMVVVPATPAFAAEPLLDTLRQCDAAEEQTNWSWTASSSDPSPDGGTADGAVRVIAERDVNGVINRFTIATGEFNDANGYQMSGVFNPWQNNIYWRIVVEVEQFNDGSGVDSSVASDWTWISHCKDGTTSSTAPTTTTSIPVTQSADVTAACVLDDGVATYPITVTVNGEEGATGTVSINGADTPYTIDATGTFEVTAEGMAGTNTVVVTDDEAGEILNQDLVLEDCTPPTTTIPVTQSATVDGSCELEGETAVYPITVTVNGEEGATGTVSINGVDTPYTIDATGTVVVTGDGAAGDNTVTVTDDEVGIILNEVLVLEDCTPATTTTPTTTPTTTTPSTTPSTTEPSTTTEASTTTQASTTTTEASSNTGSPPVSVLPTEVDQTELPQTGIDNGPLAGIGLAFLLGGAGLLLTLRRQEAISS